MTNEKEGIWNFLKMPSVYESIQSLLGGDKSRKIFVDEYVKPKPNMKILDVGCGTGRLIEYMPKGSNYIGFDFNEEYIKAAKAKYGNKGKFITAKVSEAYLGKEDFDIVIAKSIIHHLDYKEVIKLMRLSNQCLKTKGRLVTLDNAIIPKQPLISRFLILNDRGAYVRTPNCYKKLANLYFSQVSCIIREDINRVPYTHFIMDITKI